ERGETLLESQALIRVFLAVAAFCITASAIYLVNDIFDVESDRRHPDKCKRPIAAGTLSIPMAAMAAVVCVAGGLLLAWRADVDGLAVLGCTVAYLLINSLYSWRLKHVVLLDVFCIAAGFLLRVMAGGYAVGTGVSHWLLLCTMFLSLFLALCKRQAEIDLLGEDRGDHRKILLEYTPDFLGQATSTLAACAVLSYAMYTVADETQAKFGEEHGLWWTVPFVVFGLFRYMLLVKTQRGGGSPTKVLLGGDVVFVLNALMWLGVVVWCLSMAH
ncbi:MAG: UbiA prenyltransferase family protein, partial [Planctomycetota bacterium]|nr:UbiA prenyltransferase family protein [Planctomycetota bacterium]